MGTEAERQVPARVRRSVVVELAGTAVLLWGLGVSLGFPLALSAAGESCVVCAVFLAPAVETGASAEGPAARCATDADVPTTADEADSA
ncbi:hypothetical protein Sipo8835_24340 [Streptomyces ipomoeae]|uniref:Uncharacterized protein n=1 Tax=Streptomyces ipomoeae TaxID=103232 RepID=A0AAE8W2G5_9ACTN|nr:hypothetical protein Sipo8835_24340 [Streptomyces ipomoeae]